MRIAFAMINCNRRDGSARPVNEVAERLAARGHDVHLFARKVEDLDLDMVKWHRVHGPGWPEVANFTSYHWTVGSRIREGRFDIVHSIGCNSPNANVITIQNIQPAKKRILDQLGRDEKVSLARRFTRWLYLRVTSAAERRLYTYRPGRQPPLFLPVSRGVEAELRSFYAIGPAPVRIIPNAADIVAFRPRSDGERAQWRQQYGLSKDDVILIFCGGEWARKGLDLALHALALIAQPRVKLFIAGDDPDRARFKQMASELALGARVVFGGFRRDVPKALAAADMFLFPTRYEAFSLASIEAAACGLPVIASRVNGTEDFIEPGRTGEFVRHDAADIARVVQSLLNDAKACLRMGAAARSAVERNYTWDHVACQTEAAYLEYLGRTASSRDTLKND